MQMGMAIGPPGSASGAHRGRGRGAPRPRVKTAALRAYSTSARGDTHRSLLERHHRRGAKAATLEQDPASPGTTKTTLKGAAPAG